MSKPYSFAKIHSFRPFYTKQPNSTVFKHQLDAWTQILLEYCEHYKITTLTPSGKVIESQDERISSGEEEIPALFENKEINRSLDDEFKNLIFKNLVNQGKAEIKNPKSSDSGILIYWRSLIEWSQILYNYVEKTGQLNTILTVYELTKSEDSGSIEELRNLEYDLLVRVLKVLVKQGKAQILMAEDGTDQIGGVKIV